MMEGRVVSVADGDTITVLDGANVQHKIRLWGIDAPEKGQDYGAQARKAISELVFQKDVRVHLVSRDHYGRSIGKVYARDMYVNKELVRRGMAWWYRDYSPWSFDLRLAESRAKREKLGIWSQNRVVAPWTYRENKRREARLRRLVQRPTVSGRYWVTSSSGKTHNASCRYYGNSRGYASKSGTGNNCRICGGAG